jgi:dsDNA-specific endonuclease/ATPase MutS2
MMKAGDKVRFLNAVGGGVVKSVINKTMVNVEDYDGFEVPTLISELVVVDDSLSMNAEKRFARIRANEKKEEQPEIKEQPKAEPKYIAGKDSPDCYLAFVPQNEANPVDGELKVYLVNNSNNFVLYNYSHLKNKVYRSVESGKMNPNSKRYLESFTRMDLNELPDFQFQLVFFLEESPKLESPVVKSLRLNPVKFYRQNSYEKTKYFTQNAMVISLLETELETEVEKLTESEVAKVIQEKDEPKVVVKRTVSPELVEIDLHIHELLEDTRGLSNHEMLEVQLGRFRNELETAIGNGTKRIVFIHGIGNGTLKQELRKELSTKYKKYYFQDASFKEYGYGATMVILKNV